MHHTCTPTSHLSTPGSRKSQLTCRQFSGYLRSHIHQNPSYTPNNIGHFLEKEVHLVPNHLEYKVKYRAKKHATTDFFGTPDSQYSTLVSRLDHIQKNDPDSLILLKVFADILPEDNVSNQREDLSQISGLTSVESTPSNLFCLLFGAIAITPGTTVRRHKFNKDHGFTAMMLSLNT